MLFMDRNRTSSSEHLDLVRPPGRGFPSQSLGMKATFAFTILLASISLAVVECYGPQLATFKISKDFGSKCTQHSFSSRLRRITTNEAGKHKSAVSVCASVGGGGRSTRIRSAVSAGLCWVRSFILSAAFLATSGLGNPNFRPSSSSIPTVIQRNYQPAFVDSTAASNPNAMLSMSTAASKKQLIAIISSAYVIIWAFFFLTHDKGEKSE